MDAPHPGATALASPVEPPRQPDRRARERDFAREERCPAGGPVVTHPLSLAATFLLAAAAQGGLSAQPPEDVRPSPPFADGPGPRGRGGPGGREVALKARFDADRDGKLDADERARARQWIRDNRSELRGPGPFGRRRGRGGMPGPEGGEPREPGPPVRVDPRDAEAYPDRGLYDPEVVRTLFLRFDRPDWFDECADFYRTDVEVPATLLVDGQEYRGVGVGFRGNSSYFAVAGKKKSFAVAIDSTEAGQRLLGHKNLNLLNAHEDPSFLREVLHAFVARQFMPTFRANLVRLVIDGESFGVYANVQQFDKDFLDQEFGTRKGVRWKVPANFEADGLAYAGEARANYERAYQLKTELTDPAAEETAWAHLIELCRVLTETPDGQLPSELPRVLDVEAALRFLALDTVLLDGDGYGSRGSDFVLWEAPDGRFVPLPYDGNEILGAGERGRGRGPRGPGGGGPPRDGDGPVAGRGDRGRGGFGPPDAMARGGRRGPGGAPAPTSGPLLIADSGRPLARLLRVPAWRAHYLAYVRAMAQVGLDWEVLGPFLEGCHALAAPFVEVDDKALYGFAAFQGSLAPLRAVLEARRSALLGHAAMQLPWPSLDDLRARVVAAGDGASVLVTVHASGAATVLLWSSERRAAPFTAVPMHDDGNHGDGAANDGVFGALTPRSAKKGTVHVYVEAVAPEGAAATFVPPGGGGRPRTVELGPR